MKWYADLTIKRFEERFFKSKNPSVNENLEIGKKLYLASKFQDAIVYLDNAINSGFENDAYEVRGNCLQKLDYHYNAIENFDQAIEIDPLKFSIYYSRAISKRAILDFTGQIEDLHNAIYYYRKNTNVENHVLKAFETDLLTAKMNIEGLRQNMYEARKTLPSLEIKTLIKDSLHLIKKVKLRNSKVNLSK